MDERTPAGEVLDLGVLGEPDDAGPAEPAPRRTLSRRGLLLGGGGVALAGLGAVAVRTTQPPPPPPPPGPVTLGRLTRPVAGVPRGWQLFGVGTDVVVRLDLATSQVTRTRIPPLGSSQFFLVPGRRRLVVRPVDAPTGWLIRDDEPVTGLPSSLAGVGAVLAGPDLDHVWIETRHRGRPSMALVNADGWGSLPLVVPVPEFATIGPLTDGAGGLLFEGVGGLFRIDPSGRLTISNAIVLAVGRGDLLTLAPSGGGIWRSRLQLRGGRTELLPVPIGPQLPHGVLAPDAKAVVLYAVDERRRMTLTVVDLPDGGQRPVDVDITGVAGDGTVVWSPDGGRLFCLDAGGRVCVVDPASGTTADTLDLPPLRQLAPRIGT